MDIIWIGIAFVAGFFAQMVRIPTIVGYLIAGLVLSIVGIPDNSELIVVIGDLGVTLLLFTVGLHLRIKSIIQPEVLGVGSIHLLISAMLFGGIGLVVGWDLIPSVLVGVALGFSSTVLTAKSLEIRGDLNAYHGRIAIGVLILQDVVAIVLLAISGGGQPSPLALGLLLLPLLRPLLIRLLLWSGHEELMLVYGLLLALGFGVIFKEVGLDSKLGALVAGLLLSGHPKADELYEKLWGLKEVFLIGFFLQVGLSGLPSAADIPLLLILFVLLPLKSLLFFGLFLRFNLRARTAYMSSVALTAYSEFALIVVTAGVASGIIPSNVLPMVALLVTMSFIVNALLGNFAEKLWELVDQSATEIEPDVIHPDQIPATIGSTNYLVVGMGRAGTAAYDYLKANGQRPLGIDADPQTMEDHLAQGRRVIYGDSQDNDFWTAFAKERLKAILLMIPDKDRKITAAQMIRAAGYTGLIHALVRYDDDTANLLEAGIDEVSQPISRAGRDIATELVEKEQQLQSIA